MPVLAKDPGHDARLDALVAVLIFTLSLGASSAAIATSGESPQVLFLIAQKSPTSLNCIDRTCTGFFSAFCMQEKRAKPTAFQQYDLAAVDDLTVTFTKRLAISPISLAPAHSNSRAKASTPLSR